MAKGRRKESDFTEDIDRLISGRELEAGSTADGEYRANLDFAGKISAAHSRPSPAFQASLKAKLLSKLAESETAKDTIKKPSFTSWLAGLYRQKAWQVAGVTAAVLVITLVVVWRIGLFSQTPVLTTPYPVIAVEARVILDNESYAIGEVVKIDFSFYNRSSETLVFDFPPAIRIESLNAELIRSYSAGQTKVSLSSDESISYLLTWDQTDATGLQVPPGEYQIVMPNVNLGNAGYLSLPQSPLIIILGQ